MSKATVTFTVDEELKAAFDKAARARNQSDAELLRGFMQDVVDGSAAEPGYDDWFRAKVEEAIREADAGDVMDQAEVKAHFAARRRETLRRLGRHR
jgi:predicted transcriptional regulator